MSGQDNTASTAIAKRSEVERLKSALAQSLNKIADLEDKLKSADELVISLQDEVIKAKRVIELNEVERQALQRTIAAAEREAEALRKALEAEREVAAIHLKRAELAEARVDKLEVEKKEANKRAIFGTIGGIVIGVLLGLKGF